MSRGQKWSRFALFAAVLAALAVLTYFLLQVVLRIIFQGEQQAMASGLTVVGVLVLTFVFRHRLTGFIDQTIGRRSFGLIMMALAVAFFLIFPLDPTQSIYDKGVFIGAFFYAIMASSWALLAGVAGQFSFAHMALMGTSVYAAGFLGRYGFEIAAIGLNIPAGAISPLLAVIIGTAVSGVVGLIIGALVLRLRAAYLALFTIASAELFRLVIVTEFDYTGGMNGLSLRRLVDLGDSALTRNANYYLMFGLLVLSLALMYFITRSRVGLFLRAMREDEEASSALGVNVVRYKVLIFVITSMVVGLAGAVFYHNVGAERITPETLEILQMSLVIAYAVIGGMESLLGAAAGAILSRYLLELIREIIIPLPLGLTLADGSSAIRFEPGAWRFALFGIVMVLTLRFARNGLLYPLLRWFSARDAVERETVAKRQQAELEAGLENVP